MARRRAGVLTGGAMALALAACSAGGGTQLGTGVAAGNQPKVPQSALSKRTSVRVALLLPLSKAGPGGVVAKNLKQAGELALFEFDRRDVILFTKDTKGTPEGALKAAQSAIQSGAELIIGPLYADSVRAASAVAANAKVPMLAFSSDRAVAGDNVYLLSFLAGEDLPRIVDYATGQGKRRYAALVPKTPYGDIIERGFRNAVNRAGGQVLTVQRYPLDANGMLKPVEAIKEAAQQAEARGQPLDALLIPAGQEAIPTLSPLMPYFSIDTKKIQLIGTGNWDYPNIGAEKPFQGGWFPAPNPRGWQSFAQRYAKTYGKPPPRIASIAYDAVSLAVSLSSNPVGQRFTRANLTRASGFAGVDGLFRLRADGTAERGLAVLEVQKFGPRVIDSAPSAFGSAQFTAARRSLPATFN